MRLDEGWGEIQPSCSNWGQLSASGLPVRSAEVFVEPELSPNLSLCSVLLLSIPFYTVDRSTLLLLFKCKLKLQCDTIKYDLEWQKNMSASENVEQLELSYINWNFHTFMVTSYLKYSIKAPYKVKHTLYYMTQYFFTKEK